MADSSLVVPTIHLVQWHNPVGASRNCCQPDVRTKRRRRRPIKCCTTCPTAGVAYMPHFQEDSFVCGVGQGILFKEPVLGVRGSVQSPALVRLGWFECACHRCQFRNCLVQSCLGVLQTGFVGFSYNLMLRIESPPNSKKLSWMPTCSTRRTSAQISASTLRPGCSDKTDNSI